MMKRKRAAALRWLVSITLLAQTAGFAAGGAYAEEAGTPLGTALTTAGIEQAPYVEGEVLVKYKSGTSTTERSELRQSMRLVPKTQLVQSRTEVLKLAPGTNVEETIAELEANDTVEHAQPNYLYYPSSLQKSSLKETRNQIEQEDVGASLLPAPGAPETFDYLQNWGLQNNGQLLMTESGVTGTAGLDIDATDSWYLNENGEFTQIIVAVIDTGVDIQHPDLAPHIWLNPGEIAGNNVDDDNNGYVDDVNGWDFANNDNSVYDSAQVDEHGTHVAGTIAAVIGNGGTSGAATNVKIMPLKFLSNEGGSTADAIEAIAYASANGALISNNSWNGMAKYEDELLRAAIEAANTLFIGSAGNGDRYGDGINSDNTSVSPNYLNTSKQLTVAAVDSKGALAGFSNYGLETVHVGAPGVDIYSTLPNGSYGFMDGTSMAAPHVAAVAAMVMGQKNLSIAQTKQLIIESGKPLPSLEGKTATGKMVNMYNALSTPLTIESFTPGNTMELANTSYHITFRTSEYGALQAGDEVELYHMEAFYIPYGTNVPASAISINGQVLEDGEVVYSSDNRMIKMAVPVAVGNGELVTIEIREEAGIYNNVAGSYEPHIFTSSDAMCQFEEHYFAITKDFDLKVIRYDQSSLFESVTNDGTVTATVYGHLENDTFTGDIGEVYGSSKVTVHSSNPDLQVTVRKESDTSVSVDVYGDYSENPIPIDYFYLVFTNEAFGGGVSEEVFPTSFFLIQLLPPTSMSYSNTLFIESDADDGSIQTTSTVYFNGTLSESIGIGSELNDTQVLFDNLPAGLTGKAERIAEGQILLTLEGNAAAHATANDALGVTVRFLDGAFEYVDADQVMNAVTTDFQVFFKDAPGQVGDVQVTQDGTFVNLTWTLAADADGYTIYRSEDGTKFYPYVKVDDQSTEFTDQIQAVLPKDLYYRVDAHLSSVKTSSSIAPIELEATETLVNGYIDLNGRDADNTKVTVRKEGQVVFTDTYDKENPASSETDEYSIWAAHEVGEEIVALGLGFFGSVGSYDISVENGTWTAQRTVSIQNLEVMNVEDVLYYYQGYEIMTLQAPPAVETPYNPGSGPIITVPPAGETELETNPDGDIVFRPSAETEIRDGTEVSVVAITADQLKEALESGGDTDSALVIEVETEGAYEVKLPLGALAELEGFPTVQIQSKNASYRVPKSLVIPSDLNTKFGTTDGDWTLTVQMNPVNGTQAAEVEKIAAGTGTSVLGTPVDFTMQVSNGNQVFDFNEFGNTYVERTISVTGTANAQNTTAALYDPTTGTLTFVPAVFETKDGNTVATIKRNGNSTYVLLDSKKSFSDTASHWAKRDIELLASKLVLNGSGVDTFSPNATVTRAEFAAMLTRALGLSANAEAGSFSDVEQEAWYAGAVGAAVEYELITGFEDGTFRPNEQISREQMAVMFARALAFVDKSSDNAEEVGFTDADSIAAWAADAVATVGEAGIVNGLPDGSYAPQAVAVRAEAAVMLKRFLDYVEFID